MPLAAHAVWKGDTLHLDAAWGEPEQPAGAAVPAPLVRAQGSAPVASPEQAMALGQETAQRLRAGGALPSSA